MYSVFPIFACARHGVEWYSIMGGILIFFIFIHVLTYWFFIKFVFGFVKTKKWIFSILSGFFCLPVTFIGFITLWFVGSTYYPDKDFTKEKWSACPDNRYELTADLIEHKLLIGKTKKEVLYMLGESYDNFESDSWGYYIGYIPMMINIAPATLYVYFKNGRVTELYEYEG